MGNNGWGGDNNEVKDNSNNVKEIYIIQCFCCFKNDGKVFVWERILWCNNDVSSLRR